jgi:hypothetical protein
MSRMPLSFSSPSGIGSLSMPDICRQPTLYQSGITGARCAGNSPGMAGAPFSISCFDVEAVLSRSESVSCTVIVGTTVEPPFWNCTSVYSDDVSIQVHHRRLDRPRSPGADESLTLLSWSRAFPAAAPFSAGDAAGSKECTATRPLSASCLNTSVTSGRPFVGRLSAMQKGKGNGEDK